MFRPCRVFRPFVNGFLRRFCSGGSYKEDLLHRTSEIFETKEAHAALSHIRPGSTIGLDIEGHHQIQLLQLRDESKNLFIFRIASNPELLSVLAPILEDGDITKVLHQSYKDLFSFHRAGIRLWGLFDTALAHKVYLYQAYGHSLYGKNTISYAHLCSHHGYEIPTLSNSFSRWERSQSRTPLCEEDRLYCSLDVDHLLDLHLVISSLLDPDYRILAKEISEKEILRVLEPEYGIIHRERHRSLDKNDVFISQIPPGHNPFYFYEHIRHLPGRKKMYFSSTYGTLHMLFERRSSTIRSKFLLEKESLKETSSLHGTDISLLIPIKPLEQGKGPLIIQELFPKLVSLLISVSNIPIVIDFGLSQEDEENEVEIRFMDLYLPNGSWLRIPLSDKESLEALRTFFESDSITKVVYNMSQTEYAKGAQSLSSCGIKLRGMVDLCSSYKLYLYAAFQANPFSLNFVSRKEFLRNLGLDGVENRLESFLFAYIHLSRSLCPPRILDFIGALSKLDSDIILSAPSDLELRIVKGRFKNKLIYETLAIQSKSLVGSELESTLKSTLSPLSSSPDVRLLRDSLALVEFSSPQMASECINLLSESSNLTVLPWKKQYVHSKGSIPSASNLSQIHSVLHPFTEAMNANGLTPLLDSASSFRSEDVFNEAEENIASEAFP